MYGNNGAGKGDTYRKLDYDMWSKNYDAIFKKVRKKNGNKTSSTNDRRTTSKRSEGGKRRSSSN